MKVLRIRLENIRRSIGALLRYLFISLIAYFLNIFRINQKWNQILVIDLFAIGDAVTITPFIKNLKMNLQNTKIDVICSQLTSDVYAQSKYTDKIIVLDKKQAKKTKNIIVKIINEIKYYRKIAFFCYKNLNKTYSAVFVPRWDFDDERSADIAKLSGAPKRVGFSENTTLWKSFINIGRNRYFTHVYSCRPDCLESEKYLSLLEQVGYKIFDRTVRLPFEHITVFNGIDLGKPYAVLALDTSSRERDWDIENFVKISKYLNNKGISSILLGTNKVYEQKFKNLGGARSFFNL